MLIEMRLLSNDSGDAKKKPEQYRVERQAVFQCEVLSKQILHGINSAYKSKRQYKDHSFQGRFQITGERRTISIVQVLYDPSIKITLLGYGKMRDRAKFMEDLRKLCEEQGLLFCKPSEMQPNKEAAVLRK